MCGGAGVCPALLLPARGTGGCSPLPAAAAHSAGRPAAGRVGCPGGSHGSGKSGAAPAAGGARQPRPVAVAAAAAAKRYRGAGPRRTRRPRRQLGSPCGHGRDEGTGTERDK